MNGGLNSSQTHNALRIDCEILTVQFNSQNIWLQENKNVNKTLKISINRYNTLLRLYLVGRHGN